MHFFGRAELGPQPPVNASASKSVANSPVQQDGSASRLDNDVTSTSTAAMVSAANDIITLSQDLILTVRGDPAITKSLNSIRSRLSALVHSAKATGNCSHLPEKEIITPNQLSCLETAA
jgi:hypothetical protein